MKILLATESYYPNIDGGAVAQHNLVHELKKRGHEISVVAPGYHFRNYTESDNGITVFRTWSITLPFYMKSRYRFSPFPLFKIRNIIKKLKFLAVEHDKNLTELFLEAIQDLFKKYERKAKK